MGKREQKRRKMAGVIERWERSGKSARAFSEEAKVAESRLRYWKSRIRREAVAQPGFVPVTILPDEPAGPALCFELSLGDGRLVRIPPSLTGRPLRQLLAALGSC